MATDTRVAVSEVSQVQARLVLVQMRRLMVCDSHQTSSFEQERQGHFMLIIVYRDPESLTL